MRNSIFFILFTIGLNIDLCSQNEMRNWYFGYNAGLDFSTTPPTPLTGPLRTLEGCASVSDAAGNLLFYTNGATVWNQNHGVIGMWLSGNFSTTQSAVIVKQPGNTNIYFIFTLFAGGGAALRYSTVDMSLNGGLGAVTATNTMINFDYTEKQVAVKHCNGIDTWLLACPDSPNVSTLHAYLINAAGLNTSPIVSHFNGHKPHYMGQMKVSPNGKKIALANYSDSIIQVFDFDNSTGVVSNLLTLDTLAPWAYGCEFSPDGSKLYCSRGDLDSLTLYQWDLCAGSPSAIINSKYVHPAIDLLGSMQLGSDGKIYVATPGKPSVGVINNPNVYGAGFNFVRNGISLGNDTCQYGLPNFSPSPLISLIPFTYTVSNVYGCNTASFTAPSSPGLPATGCSSIVNGANSILWQFGDPASGATNTSTLVNPAHAFSSQGTYTTQLILYYNCTTDTIRQQVVINQPCVTVSCSPMSCAVPGSATVTPLSGTGPFTYTWIPSGHTSSVATNLSQGTHTIFIHDSGANTTFSTVAVLSSTTVLTATVSNTPLLKCNGVATGTASIVLSGGSGNQNYYWTNGTTTQTTVTATNLSAGIYTITVVDAITACSLAQSFSLAAPPASTLTITANNQSVCAGKHVTLTALHTGGTPGQNPAYTYSWISGPATNTWVVSQPQPSQKTYTVTSADGNNCTAQQTITLYFVSPPVLSISNVTICPTQTATLSASGATTYTWNTGTGSNTLTVAPSVTTIYFVAGEVNGCVAGASASVVLRPAPLASATVTPKTCMNSTVSFNGSGGNTYLWTGPMNFNVAAQNHMLPIHNMARAGIYTLTVTDSNGCKGFTTAKVHIDPAPAGKLLSNISQSCVPFCPGFSFLPNGPSKIINTTWQLSDKTFTGTLFNHCFTSAGNYILYGKFTDSIGCKSDIAFDIQAYAQPLAQFDFLPQQPLENEPVHFTSAPGYEKHWYIGYENYESDLNTFTHAFENGGLYPIALVLKNEAGCSDTLIKTIQVEEDFSIYIPNAFTPNDDNRNDVFNVAGRGIKELSFMIFNRWGETIFETNNLQEGWDGTYKGERCPYGTYVWKVHARAFSGNKKEIEGTVLLYR